ncbi:MAG: hypothetical protein HY852_21365 [Bradyrhizobium sp.]|uniref:hypothetical protein n=1 Tax=Bradyrhizobium sp. TaxID=376 RepID=UPI0025BCF30D|nr:hypothetical protein [Bradyrhizobium sp.]MBI5264355.1 hypothetical protein [Bradyrhizobium sp.]
MALQYPSLALIAVVGSLASSSADASGLSPGLNIRTATTTAALAVDRLNSGRLARDPQADQSVRRARAGRRSTKSVK